MHDLIIEIELHTSLYTYMHDLIHIIIDIDYIQNLQHSYSI